MIRIGFHDLFFLWLTTVLYHIQRELSTSTALSHSITHRPSRTSCRSWVSLLNWIIFLLLQQHAAPGQIFSINLFGVSPYSPFNSGITGGILNSISTLAHSREEEAIPCPGLLDLNSIVPFMSNSILGMLMERVSVFEEYVCSLLDLIVIMCCWHPYVRGCSPNKQAQICPPIIKNTIPSSCVC